MSHRVAVLTTVALIAVGCGTGISTATTPASVQSLTTLAPSPTTSLVNDPQAKPPSAESITAAELVFVNGLVVTMDDEIGTVESIAVSGDRVVAVGLRSTLSRYIGPETLVVDLEGRTIIPGFIDPHTHLLTDAGGIAVGQALALENGITSVGEASAEPGVPEAFIEADDSGSLKVRTSLYLARTDACGVDLGYWYENLPAGTVFSNRLRIAGVKLFVDGGTCGQLAMSEPFLDGFETAEPFRSLDELIALMTETDALGYQLAVHAQGDLAIIQAQDAYGTFLSRGENPLRHRIDHNVFPTEESIARYADLGLIPLLFGSSEACNADLAWTDFYRENAERPGDIVTANPELIIAWHGDDPWVTPINPLAELFSLVTRGRVTENGEICEAPDWMSTGGVSVDQGLAMMTINAAYALNQEDLIGSLTPGKLADLLVLSANPLTVLPQNLPYIKVEATMIGGVVEFCGRSDLSLCAGSGPSAIVASASASRSGHGPDLAFDNSSQGESFWSSGDDAPQWLQFDFAEPTQLSSITFTVFQNPPSDTLHELEVLTGETWTLVATFNSFTTTGDVLEWVQPQGSKPISAFRMTTLASLSWPEWYEVEVLGP